MKRPLLYSALLHLTVFLLLMIGIYNPFQNRIPSETPIMIEFVQVAEQSAAPIITPQAIPDQPLPDVPRPTPPQPESVKPEPVTQPAPPPTPEPIQPEPKPEAAPEPLPEAEAIPDPKLKKKIEKPKEKKSTPQKAEITLDKKKPSPSQKKDDMKDKKKKPSKSFDDLLSEIEKSDEGGSPSQSKGAPAATIGPVLTASEKDVLSRHMARCWIIPAGLRDARNIRVPIKIKVAPDGTVQQAEIADKSRMGTDLAYRTAAESARRAVLDSRCSPLPIPPNKYDLFKEFIFNFDPKEMF